MALTPEEIERYKRHLVLREVGGQGQQKIKAAKVLVVGAGGLGSPALMYLAAAGVGTIGARPEHIELEAGEATRVQMVERLGAESLVHLTVPGVPATVSVLSTDRSLDFDHPRSLRLPAHCLHRFDTQGRRLND